MKTAEDIAMTKECIMMSLFDLMRQKAFDDITITEIIRKAGYGRATFYRHFQTKEDVIRHYFALQQNMFQDIADFKSGNKDDYYEIIFRVFTALKDRKDMIKLIVGSGLETVYLEYLNEAMIANFKYNGYPETEYAPCLFSGSLFNVSLRWIKNDCRQSVKCIVDLFFGYTFDLDFSNLGNVQSN